ncbi:hypothetical protein C1H46_009998 [Malus baccata]|uniref:Uncharacterized protein n=1 Tax=Malus baccata TaxID=106549 RepID=A0A540N050_MALBA|nr:hypothetical protein C1H46_009998 [Malus baccata]
MLGDLITSVSLESRSQSGSFPQSLHPSSSPSVSRTRSFSGSPSHLFSATPPSTITTSPPSLLCNSAELLVAFLRSLYTPGDVILLLFSSYPPPVVSSSLSHLPAVATTTNIAIF